MNELIIIGNGFDKAHELHTDYNDFIRHIFDGKTTDQVRFEDLYSYNPNAIFKYNYEQLLTLNLGQIQDSFSFKNTFFGLAIKDKVLKNWCDFEKLYFSILKSPPEGYFKSIKEINDQFEMVKNYLFEYLKTQEQNFEKIKPYESFFSYIFNRNRSSSMIVNFNYTNTVKKYFVNKYISNTVQLHGELDNQKLNPIIFGYAATENDCTEFLKKEDNEYLRNVKKHNYKYADNFDKVMNFLDLADIKVSILGHSCGLSDNLILNQIFSAKNVKSICNYYYETYEDFFQRQVNINRICMNNNGLDKLINFNSSHRMPQHNDSKQQIIEFEQYIVRK